MNKLCVAPHHLEPVTYVQNARRYLIAEPETYDARELTTEEAKDLQTDLQKGMTREAIATKFGITPKHVRKIELGRYWDHVDEEDDGL